MKQNLKSLVITLVILLAGHFILYSQVIKNQDSIPEKPSITLQGLPPGRMSVETFKKIDKIIIPKGYTLKKTIVNFVIPGAPVEKYNLFSTDLFPVQEVMNRCVPGTVIVFEKIYTLDEKGKVVFLRNAGYTLF